MDQTRLFKVLVLGGAMLGMGCLEEAPAPPPEDDGGAVIADAAMGTDAAMVIPATDAALQGDAGELTECGFCPNEVCCHTDGTTRAGMMCCWGTSC